MIKLFFLLHYIVMVSFFIFSSALPFSQGGDFWQDPEDDFVGARMEASERRRICEDLRRTVLQHPRASEKLKEKVKSIDCSNQHCLQICEMLIKKLIVSMIAQERKNK